MGSNGYSSGGFPFHHPELVEGSHATSTCGAADARWHEIRRRPQRLLGMTEKAAAFEPSEILAAIIAAQIECALAAWTFTLAIASAWINAIHRIDLAWRQR